MTVPSSVARNDYVGNGATTVFPYGFRIYDETDLVVVTRDASGVETVAVLTTDYTVSGVGSYSGGSVTFLVAPTDGHAVAILRRLPITQLTDLRNQGAFFAETHEDVFDRLTMIAQQQQDDLDRAMKLPDSLTGVDATIPGPLANYGIKWNSGGTALELARFDAYGAAAAASAAATSALGSHAS